MATMERLFRQTTEQAKENQSDSQPTKLQQPSRKLEDKDLEELLKHCLGNNFSKQGQPK